MTKLLFGQNQLNMNRGSYGRHLTMNPQTNCSLSIETLIEYVKYEIRNNIFLIKIFKIFSILEIFAFIFDDN